jgi:selenide,water dikinase
MEKIPFVSCAQKYAEMWTFPGGASDNRLHVGPRVQFAAGIAEARQMLLFDPQTSGGLLLPVPGSEIAAFLKRAQEIGQPAWVIGEVVDGSGIEVI